MEMKDEFVLTDRHLAQPARRSPRFCPKMHCIDVVVVLVQVRLAQRSIRVITWKNVRAGNVVNDVFGDVVICDQNIGPVSFTSYVAFG